MPFSCKRCEYESSRQLHLLSHLQRKTPCTVTKQDIPRETLIEEINTVINETKNGRHYARCEWCDSSVTVQNMSRHRKSCSSKPQSDIDDLKTKYNELKEHVEKLMQAQATAPNVTNVVIDNSTHVTNVMNINTFGSERLEHIQGDYVKHCILNNLRGMKSLIEKIHFSEEVPENKNIRIKSIKNKLVEVKGQDKWIVKDANEAMETMINKGCRLANKYYLDDRNGLMERDLNELDMRIQKFLTEVMERNSPAYFALRKRILALIIENSDDYE